MQAEAVLQLLSGAVAGGTNEQATRLVVVLRLLSDQRNRAGQAQR